MKSSLKKKIARIRNSQRKTGGGPPSNETLSEEDQFLANIISIVNVSGIDINESKVLKISVSRVYFNVLI